MYITVNYLNKKELGINQTEFQLSDIDTDVKVYVNGKDFDLGEYKSY